MSHDPDDPKDDAESSSTFRVDPEVVEEPRRDNDRHVSRRKIRQGARSKVLARWDLKRAVAVGRVEENRHPTEPVADRPRTRGDCAGHVGPCPWVGCRHHLYLSVNPESGAITLNFPDKEPWELAETCALDVADRGGITLEQVGELTNVTRERIRQVEAKGFQLIRARMGLSDEDARDAYLPEPRYDDD